MVCWNAGPGMIRGECWSMSRSRSPTARSLSATCRCWLISRGCTARLAARVNRDDLAGARGCRDAPGTLTTIRQARAQARARAWLARGELTGVGNAREAAMAPLNGDPFQG